MAKRKKPGRLPIIYAQDGQTVSTMVVAITGMVNGNYGDVQTGPGDKDFVHVTRLDDGSWRAVHQSRRESTQTDNALRIAQFIMDRVEQE